MNFIHKTHTPDVIYHRSELGLIEAEWRELHKTNHWKSPLRSFEYLKLWYDCFSEPDQVKIYRIKDQDQTIGFIPFVLRVQKGIRVLESLTNDHCLHSDPLLRNGYEAVFQTKLLQLLLQKKDEWDVIRHSFSYSFSQLPGLFSRETLVEGHLQWRQGVQPTYIISLPKSFEDYFRKDLSAKLRSNFKRGQNYLKEAGIVNFSHSCGLEAVKHWPQFLTLEDSGWKGKEGSSIKKISSPLQQYYAGLVNILGHSGALHIYFLELSGEPIAGVFGYIDQDVFHYAKIGYDENFSKFNPSNTLLIYIIQDLIENYPEVKRFNMFPWDYSYKHRYANENSVFFETVLYSKTFRGNFMRISDTLRQKLSQIPATRRIAHLVRSFHIKKK